MARLSCAKLSSGGDIKGHVGYFYSQTKRLIRYLLSVCLFVLFFQIGIKNGFVDQSASSSRHSPLYFCTVSVHHFSRTVYKQIEMIYKSCGCRRHLLRFQILMLAWRGVLLALASFEISDLVIVVAKENVCLGTS